MTDASLADIDTSLRRAMPLATERLALGDEPLGLVIVDEVNGFAAVGYGNLAPAGDNPQVSRMVSETDRLARAFSARGWPLLALLDTHEPGKAEQPRD